MEISSPEANKRSGDEECLAISSPKKTKTEDVRLQEENIFYELKNFVLDTMIKLKNVSECDIEDALLTIYEAFKNFTFSEINLAQWNYGCAYFHRYGAQGFGLTRFKVLDALQNCKDLALKFKKKDLHIVCLGGGPGIDIVGLTSALYESKIQCDLNITIVDSVKEWSSFVKILHVFIKEGNYGNASKYFHQNKVNLSFVEAQLPNAFKKNQNCIRILREADVILMVRFISGVKKEDKFDAIEIIYHTMKNGALALVIDAPYFEDNWLRFKTLYHSKTVEEYYYNLPSPTKRFGYLDCTSSIAQVAVLRKD